MIYLTGSDTAAAPAAGLGVIVQPATYGQEVIERYRWWAADNGCFTAGADFDEAAWWRWLWRVERCSHWNVRTARSFCLFAVAPDVVADPLATYRRTWTKLHHLRRHGLPAAFAAQDGLEDLDMVRRAWFWDEFDCLFIGGTTAWKLGPAAAWLAGEARARRKWVHMGRVNSARRLRHAARVGALSVDGTFLAYGPDVNLPRIARWLDSLDQVEMPIGDTYAGLAS